MQSISNPKSICFLDQITGIGQDSYVSIPAEEEIDVTFRYILKNQNSTDIVVQFEIKSQKR